MILAVDIGNTTISVGCFEEDRIQFVESISTNKNSTALEYTVLIKTVLELNGMSGQTFQGGIISSVVPSVTPKAIPLPTAALPLASLTFTGNLNVSSAVFNTKS